MPNRKEQLLDMLKEDPQDGFLRYAYACELEKEGDVATAIEVLNKLRNDQPEYHGLYYKLGELLEIQGKDSDAIAAYKQGIEVCSELGETKIKSELEQALWLLD